MTNIATTMSWSPRPHSLPMLVDLGDVHRRTSPFICEETESYHDKDVVAFDRSHAAACCFQSLYLKNPSVDNRRNNIVS